jgi:hypothetical protein
MSAFPDAEDLDSPAVAALLGRALGRAVDVEEVVVRAARPGRRLVLEARVAGADGPVRYGLKFRHRRAGAIFADWRLLAARQAAFELPEPLALLEERGCIVYRWAEGPSLLAALREDEGWAATAGRAIAGLHAAPFELPRRHDAAAELAMLEEWISRAAESGHPRAADLRGVLGGLRRDAEADEAPLTPGHRDFYPWQLLATSPPTLLDVDEAAMCELPLDAGNFAAHLAVDGLPDLVEPFLDAAVADARARRRAEFYRRAALARLAAVYWVRDRREAALAVPFT